MLKFGFSAVVSGVRNIASNNEPNLVANSTKAKFTITGLVSRAMGLIPGDNVQFVNNLDSINNAILERDPDLLLSQKRMVLTLIAKNVLMLSFVNLVLGLLLRVFLCWKKMVVLVKLLFVRVRNRRKHC